MKTELKMKMEMKMNSDLEMKTELEMKMNSDLEMKTELEMKMKLEMKPRLQLEMKPKSNLEMKTKGELEMNSIECQEITETDTELYLKLYYTVNELAERGETKLLADIILYLCTTSYGVQRNVKWYINDEIRNRGLKL